MPPPDQTPYQIHLGQGLTEEIRDQHFKKCMEHLGDRFSSEKPETPDTTFDIQIPLVLLSHPKTLAVLGNTRPSGDGSIALSTSLRLHGDGTFSFDWMMQQSDKQYWYAQSAPYYGPARGTAIYCKLPGDGEPIELRYPHLPDKAHAYAQYYRGNWYVTPHWP